MRGDRDVGGDQRSARTEEEWTGLWMRGSRGEMNGRGGDADGGGRAGEADGDEVAKG